MSIYGCLSEVLFTAARPLLGRKYTEGNDQRYGHYDPSIAKNALWVHAVSVGEVQSAYPFVEQVRARMPRLPVLLSTVTQTGRRMSGQLLGETITPIYYPWDAPSILRRALDTLRPRAFVSVETEIWPEMLHQLKKRRIPSFLLNARLSQCKADALMERKNRADLSELAPFFSPSRRVIIAGSTHPGEETCVFQAYKALKGTFPDLRIVVVPRHPQRALSVTAEARRQGLKGVCVMSETKENQPWDVMVVDRIGVLFPAYGFAEAAFLGGSLVQKGGQNVMEPAIWGIPCCQGPDYHDFTQATRALCGVGLCQIVHNAHEMTRFFESVLQWKNAETFRKASDVFFASLGGAALRSWKLVEPYLSSAASKHEGEF